MGIRSLVFRVNCSFFESQRAKERLALLKSESLFLLYMKEGEERVTLVPLFEREKLVTTIRRNGVSAVNNHADTRFRNISQTLKILQNRFNLFIQGLGVVFGPQKGSTISCHCSFKCGTVPVQPKLVDLLVNETCLM